MSSKDTADAQDTSFPKSVKMKYLRYIDDQVLYYNGLLSSENLPPAKRRQLTDKYNILQASKKHLLSQDPDSIMEDSKENEVKIVSSDIGISEDSPGVNDNTLLKSLPFLGWGKDVDDKITKIVNDPDSLHNPRKLNLLKLTTFNSGSESVRAGPVLHVISVSISKIDGSDWEEFEIYGQISITDEKNNTFYIYNCEQNDPELICPKFNSLFLNGPTTPVYTGGDLKFSILNKDGDIKILEGNYNVDYTIDDVNENKSVIKCGGRDYCASMEFTKIPFACIANVSMFILDATGKVGTFDMHGTVKVNDVLCFEAPSTNPVVMRYGVKNNFPQYRTVLAIPVYSKLVAEIKLRIGDHVVADDELEAFPSGFRPHVWDVYCKDRNFCFYMYAVWIEYDDFTEIGGGYRWVDNVNVKWNTRDNLHQIYDRPAAVDSNCALVEVFSVFVGGGDSTPLPLCGTIVVRDRVIDKTVYIFSRNHEFPDNLSIKHYGLPDVRSRIVSLAWPSDRWFVEKDFYMDFKLEDNHGGEVCRGGVTWWHEPCNVYPSRYDKRLCDVIEGCETGYFVAVHYSIFYNGKKAKVTVEWNGPDCVVFGSIDAEYINYGYPSTYYKTFYQNIIFKRSWEDCLNVKSCSEIPLSKSHVSAPSDCQGLTIYVNLHVAEPAVNELGLPLVVEHTFEFKSGGTDVKQGEPISVKVEWFL